MSKSVVHVYNNCLSIAVFHHYSNVFPMTLISHHHDHDQRLSIAVFYHKAVNRDCQPWSLIMVVLSCLISIIIIRHGRVLEFDFEAQTIDIFTFGRLALTVTVTVSTLKYKFKSSIKCHKICFHWEHDMLAIRSTTKNILVHSDKNTPFPVPQSYTAKFKWSTVWDFKINCLPDGHNISIE